MLSRGPCIAWQQARVDSGDIAHSKRAFMYKAIPPSRLGMRTAFNIQQYCCLGGNSSASPRLLEDTSNAVCAHTNVKHNSFSTFSKLTGMSGRQTMPSSSTTFLLPLDQDSCTLPRMPPCTGCWASSRQKKPKSDSTLPAGTLSMITTGASAGQSACIPQLALTAVMTGHEGEGHKAPQYR